MRIYSFFPSSSLDFNKMHSTRNRFWFFGTFYFKYCISNVTLNIPLKNPLFESNFAEMLSSMARASGQDLVCNGSFHEAFGPVLIIAQCLAMLPVTGVKSSSAYSLKFSWRSYRTIYSLVALGFATLYTIFATCITLTKPVTFNSFGLCDAFVYSFSQ